MAPFASCLWISFDICGITKDECQICSAVYENFWTFLINIYLYIANTEIYINKENLRNWITDPLL